VRKEEFGVPNNVVGLVIGKGGENLKRIEAASGARIQFGPGMIIFS
jgi:far upstream element-binding protein